ncbi:dormancy-associated protein homolog 3-like isoform X2 [Gastrolobium bilobum]|uniref:dormancy-associated protein homolog 3-like isoform X2 n=1 Tax=Gastrolobium bilobum TaxID=150636 RepID=UPI002AB13204|nr:dormancy-associated protein homolog 3-like isoform X2 [Gastrolobium bilobum]
MGLLDHLWDDTVAGPQPENGLGKLRKRHTFAFGSSSGKDAGSVRSNGQDLPEDAVKVTRSIMIVKPPGYQSQSGSAPASPAGSTPPVSPFSGEDLDQSPSGFEEGRHQMRTRRQARRDQALLLLSMCEK